MRALRRIAWKSNKPFSFEKQEIAKQEKHSFWSEDFDPLSTNIQKKDSLKLTVTLPIEEDKDPARKLLQFSLARKWGKTQPKIKKNDVSLTPEFFLKIDQIR